jgi:ACS family glucarate transporter-like MFS transporter
MTNFHQPSDSSATPQQRRKVVGAVAVVSFLTILARVGISGAKIDMARELGISDLTFGVVFGAFAFGYAVFMLPSGLLADRWGPRKSLALSVFFWSFFTLCTGLVSGIATLIAVRFLFGLAEAGVFPQATRAVHNWTLARQRGLALGLLNTGSRLGAAFGLAVVPLCVARFGWRASFVVLGISGAIWSGVWYWWFRDAPAVNNPSPAPSAESVGAAHQRQDRSLAFLGERVSRDDAFFSRRGTGAGVPNTEALPVFMQPSQPAIPNRAAAGGKFPWRAFASSRNFYLIIYQYFACNFAFFICFSWLFPFLKTRFALTSAQAGLYSSIPLYAGALATWSGGAAVDWIYQKGRLKTSRAGPAMLGFALATVTLCIAPYMGSPGWFIACFALMTFGVDVTLSSSWTVCCDVGVEYSGTLSAAMNTLGAMGSLASSLLFPLLMNWTGNVKAFFYLAAVINVIALACWKYIDPARTLLHGASPKLATELETGQADLQRSYSQSRRSCP